MRKEIAPGLYNYNKFPGPEFHLHGDKVETEGIAFSLVENIKEAFDEQVGSMQAESSRISQELANLFAFVEKIFGDGNEMLILVTDLTVNADSMKFISRNGSKEYFKYNKKYQLYERQQEIADALEQLQI